MAGFSLGRNHVFCIPCEFVDYCMKDANPTFIAVYIYGYRQCYSENPKSTVADVASSLSILESDVIKAWKYWESRGVVTLIYNSESDPSDFLVQFSDLSSIAPKKEEKAEGEMPSRPAYKMSEISDRQSSDRALAEMYEHAHMLLGRPLSQNDTMTLYSFYDWLSLPVEVILMIIEHCASLEKRRCATSRRSPSRGTIWGSTLRRRPRRIFVRSKRPERPSAALKSSSASPGAILETRSITTLSSGAKIWVFRTR